MANIRIGSHSSHDYQVAENIGFDMSSPPYFITLYAGLYYLNVSASFSGGLNDEFTLQFAIDDVAIPECKVNFTQKGANYWDVSMALLYRIEGSGGGVFDVLITNNSDTDNITLRKFTQTMVKLN